MNKTLTYFLVLALAVFVSFFAIKSNFSFQATGLLLFILVFVPVLIKPGIGLIIIIASMLLSPEIIMGRTSGRYVTVRIEDILLMVVVFAWLLRTAFTKDIVSMFRTRLTGPFFLYIFICLVATSFTIYERGIGVKHSLLYILKYVEYFLLFLMVRDSINSIGQVKIYIVVFLLTTVVVAAYSNIYIENQLSAGTQFFRVAPPVETTNVGESGTLGGYLVFMMAIAGGLLLYLRSVIIKALLFCLMLIMFRAFLYTLSRGSYLAIVPMAIGLICFTGKGKFVLVSGVVISLVVLIMFAPRMVKERITTTVIEQYDESGKRLTWDESPANRLQSWKSVLFYSFPDKPIFGHGVGGAFIDGQIFLTLYEVGALGFFLLGSVIVGLFKMARDVLKLEEIRADNFAAGLSVGFLAGFLGLIGHALSSNTFIIIKIMEPFWFIAAIVLSLPRLLEEKKAADAAPDIFIR
ncbi:MAG: O-antigen ligase family protein [Candidatus Omnitrophica bacterium]|nr:O-antigen ligase family protein [Candidatus Omnitrophota bacterium]